MLAVALSLAGRLGRLAGVRAAGNLATTGNEPPLFDKILIANRGEIACRVIRTAKRLGVRTVAVFSDADRNALHVTAADEAYFIGPPPARESYLRGERILEVARSSGAQAIHPGYGFLSENARFAEACEKAGVVFIGPPPAAIDAMGSKSASKDIMIRAKVPVVPGFHGVEQEPATLRQQAERIGYPVLIKAVMGGGGKGMRIVDEPQQFDDALQSAKRESLSSFGDDRVLIEKYLRRPRHIEVQVFADRHGNCVYLFERDCSLQRRHQKVIEEAPAPGISAEQRASMGQAAVNAAKAVGYVGAGTVEFIVDEDGTFYFMEMNTRLQVEHPITEKITGQDLVEWQLKVAAGRRLPLQQTQLHINGHAFEARIYAENPASGFLPGSGRLVHLATPQPSEQVRIDTGVRQGDEVTVFYDPMIAKLICWGQSRDEALRRLRLALDDYRVIGLATNIAFLKRVADHPAFIAAQVSTAFIDKHKADLIVQQPPSDLAAVLAALALLERDRQQAKCSGAAAADVTSPWASLGAWRPNYQHTRSLHFERSGGRVQVEASQRDDGVWQLNLNGRSFSASEVQVKANGDMRARVDDRLLAFTVVEHADSLHVFVDGDVHCLEMPPPQFAGASLAQSGSMKAPMPGKIVKVAVRNGDSVEKGATLIIMEAMKMEHTIRAPTAGKVTSVHAREGELVDEKKVLVVVQ